MNHSIYWHLPPLILAVGFVYAATRHEDWARIGWRTLFWIRYIVVFLFTAFVAVAALQYFKRDSWIPASILFALWLVNKAIRRSRGKKASNSPTGK